MNKGITISDAAQRLKLEAHVLRYWEEELGLEISRNSQGHRYYSERDIRMFEKIIELKKEGYSLKDIEEAIASVKRERQHSNYNQADTLNGNSTYNLSGNTADTLNGNSTYNSSGNRTDKTTDNSSDISNSNTKDNIVDFKEAQLQNAMNRIIANALRENKSIITTALKAEITEDVMKQMDIIIREKEEREEERFRKLDEVIRKQMVLCDEVAATKSKRGIFRRKAKR